MIFKYDDCLFEKINGKWICKSWAMKGPRGTMMNKEVPEPYCSKIEVAYQKEQLSLDNKNFESFDENKIKDIESNKTYVKFYKT